TTSSGPFPNTVKVQLRRDSQANGPLKLFFAPVLGRTSVDVVSMAAATCYSATYDSFAPSNANIPVLPITYDVNHWNDFLATGKDPGGNINRDNAGNPVLKVYPSSLNTAGNFGELSLNDSHNGAGTTAHWIEHGMSSGDLQTLRDH